MGECQPIAMHLEVGRLAVEKRKQATGGRRNFSHHHILCREEEDFERRGHDGALRNGWIQV